MFLTAAEGLNNAPGYCGSPVLNVGGLAVRGAPGIFNGSLSLQFYIYALQGPPVPDVVLKIASDEVLANTLRSDLGGEPAHGRKLVPGVVLENASDEMPSESVLSPAIHA